MYDEGEFQPKNEGNPLRLYDNLKVGCVKDHHETYAQKRQESLINDMKKLNAEYLARAEAAESENMSINKFLSLFAWQQNENQPMSDALRNCRSQLLDSIQEIDMKTRMHETQIQALKLEFS